jgi:hypothetical protein
MPFNATSQFLMTDQFHWLSLSEINNNLFLFHWLFKEECKQYFDDNLVSSLPVMNVGPPPSATTYDTPMIPSISSLTTAIIIIITGARTSYSPFLNWLAPMRLKNGDFSGLLSRNLCQCIHCVYKMGGFLSNFISATLQTLGTWWSINAFGFNTIQTASFGNDCLWQRLILFVHQLLWLTTLPAISYLHSKNGWTWCIETLSFTAPLNFSLSKATRQQDHVSQTDWKVLKLQCNMVHNPLLNLDVPSYSIHVDRVMHVLFHNTVIARQLILMASHTSDTSGLLLPPWKKVLV